MAVSPIRVETEEAAFSAATAEVHRDPLENQARRRTRRRSGPRGRRRRVQLGYERLPRPAV